MQTVAQTHAFCRAAAIAGMSEDRIEALVSFVAENPTAGDVIVGTSGCRKLRWAGGGRGKSGGFRIITFYTGQEMPVFLLTVFGKGEKTNLSRSECNALRKITGAIVEAYQAKTAAPAAQEDK